MATLALHIARLEKSSTTTISNRIGIRVLRQEDTAANSLLKRREKAEREQNNRKDVRGDQSMI
jgi:hypothetical protein